MTTLSDPYRMGTSDVTLVTLVTVSYRRKNLRLYLGAGARIPHVLSAAGPQPQFNGRLIRSTRQRNTTKTDEPI